MTRILDTDLVIEMIEHTCEYPILILPVGTDLIDAHVGPISLVPSAATIVAAGRHPCLPFDLMAYLSEAAQLTIAITGPAGICHSVTVRTWEGLDASKCVQGVEFQTIDDRAVTRVQMGRWSGSPVSGYTVLHREPIGSNDGGPPGHEPL